LDRVSTGSGSDLVKTWDSKIVRKYRTLITDQVATAPCTDRATVSVERRAGGWPRRATPTIMMKRLYMSLVWLISSGILFSSIAGQTQKKAEKADETAEWTILLAELLRETKLVDNEHERAQLIAEVANSYWTLDLKLSKELFTAALDAALPLGPSKQARLNPVAEILTLAARRDVSFAKTLVKRAYENKENQPRSLKTAADLLDSSPQTAIELAMAAAAFGPTDSGMSFLFKLAEKNPLEAQQLYERYLLSFSIPRNRTLSNVLWLAGYPQGFGEAYGGGNSPAALVGRAGMRIPELSAQPRLVAVYLDLAHESISVSLTQALMAPVPEKDQLNSLSLFALDYLHEAVQTYRPDLQGHWAALRQRALSVVSPAGRAEGLDKLKSILEVRARVSEYKTGEEYATGTAQKEVEKIERITGGCQRDEAYARLVFALSYAKDFNGARQVIEKVESLKLRDALLQHLIFDETSIAIKANDLTEASRLIEKISARDLRALQYLRVAAVAAKAKDKSIAIDSLAHARTLAESTEPAVQAGILMTVASVYSQFDSLEATNAFSRAVKSLNSVKEEIPITFSLKRRVSFGCSGDEPWYGGREQGSDRNLYETLALLTKSKITANEALMLARAFEDRSVRIRAQLSVINALQK
jgi:hypothetical protein